MEDLVIFGSGGVGRLAQQIAQDINKDAPAWNILGFLDEDVAHADPVVGGLPVLGSLNWLETHPRTHVIVAIADTVARRRLTRQLEARGRCLFATLIHPRAWIAKRSSVGAGTLIYPDVLIDVDVQVGAHAILNKACTIGHDSVIGGHVTISPGVNLGGASRIGAGCDLGMNCTVLPNVSVGDWSLIGAGAVVTKDLPRHVTAVGVPAKVIKHGVNAETVLPT